MARFASDQIVNRFVYQDQVRQEGHSRPTLLIGTDAKVLCRVSCAVVRRRVNVSRTLNSVSHQSTIT